MVTVITKDNRQLRFAWSEHNSDSKLFIPAFYYQGSKYIYRLVFYHSRNPIEIIQLKNNKWINVKKSNIDVKEFRIS